LAGSLADLGCVSIPLSSLHSLQPRLIVSQEKGKDEIECFHTAKQSSQSATPVVGCVRGGRSGLRCVSIPLSSLHGLQQWVSRKVAGRYQYVSIPLSSLHSLQPITGSL